MNWNGGASVQTPSARDKQRQPAKLSNSGLRTSATPARAQAGQRVPDRADVRSLRLSGVFPGPAGDFFMHDFSSVLYHMMPIARLNNA
jgi:hypothetical protein